MILPRRFATRQLALDALWGVDGIHVYASLSWRIAALIVLAIDMNTQSSGLMAGTNVSFVPSWGCVESTTNLSSISSSDPSSDSRSAACKETIDDF